jgi:hypothetical protein
MKEHLKKALSALKVRHYVIIVLAVLVIIYGILVLLDVVETESRVTKLVSAAKSDNYVLSKDARFESQILEFLSVDKLCAVTSEQAETLKQSYTMEQKEYYLASQAKTVFILYVEGPKTNLNQLEKQVGTIDNGDCEVVKGTKVIALLAPQ